MCEPILCYVEGNWAYFTTQPLAEQWGDDWDDAPYEHNAGEPYAPCVYHYANGTSQPRPEDHNPDGSPKWTITKVAWEGPFETPRESHLNSPYSVKDINAGAVAWLRLSQWAKGGTHIPAGTTLARFIEIIQEAGGNVYFPVSVPAPIEVNIVAMEDA